MAQKTLIRQATDSDWKDGMTTASEKGYCDKFQQQQDPYLLSKQMAVPYFVQRISRKTGTQPARCPAHLMSVASTDQTAAQLPFVHTIL